jgi:hypothetical protein
MVRHGIARKMARMADITTIMLFCLTVCSFLNVYVWRPLQDRVPEYSLFSPLSLGGERVLIVYHEGIQFRTQPPLPPLTLTLSLA